MPRVRDSASEPVNSDSFLDIVASVVSIMIIMVVMEGMRIKNAPVQVSLAATPAAKELEKELAGVQSLRSDVLRVEGETRAVATEGVKRAMERDALATMVSAVEHKIQERRQQLDGTKQADFDLARGLSESRYQLDQLVRQREQVENGPAPPVVIESYSTPLSRAVDGPEAHLLIANGRVAFIPLDALLEECVTKARMAAHRLGDQDELTETVGPIDGFRLRYTLEHHEITYDTARETHHGGSYTRLRRWTLIPTANDLGEPVRLALQEGSDFRQALAKILPGRTTITIWVYPDGFAAFRQIRRDLYRLNYAIAARPLPAGTPIEGSTEGSKSAAQ
jgi:hypothetical protein